MRWACILLPQLALDGVLRGRDDRQVPLVLLTGPAQRRILQAVSEPARALGLRPGMALSAAQALASGFEQAEYDTEAIERWRLFLAAWAYGFSSQVSLHYPRCLLLEVHSSLGLFGPWPRFEARLRAELQALGFRHRITLAPNPAAARALANVHDGLAVDDPALPSAIGALPLARIGLEPSQATALARMGLRQVAQVLALPRNELARRFPAGVLQHLDTLLGRQPQALAFYRPADRFSTRIELNFEVESAQALLFPLRRMTADLAAYLASRDQGVQRFSLYLEHRTGAPTLVEVGLLNAEREAALLLEFARGRLEALQLPGPVIALRLDAEDLPAFVPDRYSLFDDRPQQSLGWEQLRERLRARLGDDAVQGLMTQADHRPERAWHPGFVPLATPLPATGPRPAWLLAAPQPLPEGSVRLLGGPERIESGWWDGEDIRRDYYRVLNHRGQQGWAFRPLGETGPLQLQGWFA